MNKTVQHETAWTHGSFPRDTLVFALGHLAESLLRMAFSDASVRQAYDQWLVRAEDDPALHSRGEALVSTGFARGRALLLARELPNEFCVSFEHPSFQGLLAIGFDLATWRVVGVYVARFDGSVVEAIQFTRALTDELARRHVDPRSLQAREPLRMN